MAEGLRITPEAMQLIHAENPGPLSLAEYASTSGATMRLGENGDIWVNAPIAEHNSNFVDNPGNVLVLRDGKLFVESGVGLVPAKVLPVPAYHEHLNFNGEKYTGLVATHSDRARISPVTGCAMACTFCNIPYELKYSLNPADKLVDAVRTAVNDRHLPAKHVLISGGTPKEQDFSYLRDVYEKVARSFPGIAVDVMMVPAPGLLDAKHLKEIGINGLSINLELFGQDLARKVMLSKVKVSRPRYFEFIKDAVEVFGRDGQVRSLLMLGIEPLEDTLRGVEALAELGCDPVLSPFRPDPATPMRNAKPPSVDMMVEAYERSVEIVERHGVKLGPRCIPCMHNTLTFPDGSSAYYYS